MFIATGGEESARLLEAFVTQSTNSSTTLSISCAMAIQYCRIFQFTYLPFLPGGLAQFSSSTTSSVCAFESIYCDASTQIVAIKRFAGMSNAAWSASHPKHALKSGSVHNCSSYLIVIVAIGKDKEAFKLSFSRFSFSFVRDLIELKAIEGKEEAESKTDLPTQDSKIQDTERSDKATGKRFGIFR
jgi:hypothetical protein